jgi:hypothetical protein
MHRRDILLAASSLVAVPGCSSLGTESPEKTSNPQESGNSNNAEKTGALIGGYRAGYDALDTGRDTLDVAISSFDPEGSQGRVDLALDGFGDLMNTAKSSFQEAESIAQDMGKNGVADAARAGQREASHMQDCAEYLREGDMEVSKENFDKAQQKLAQARTSLQNAMEAHQELLEPSQVRSRVS